jgi:hypothetical protein
MWHSPQNLWRRKEPLTSPPFLPGIKTLFSGHPAHSLVTELSESHQLTEFTFAYLGHRTGLKQEQCGAVLTSIGPHGSLPLEGQDQQPAAHLVLSIESQVRQVHADVYLVVGQVNTARGASPTYVSESTP